MLWGSSRAFERVWHIWCVFLAVCCGWKALEWAEIGAEISPGFVDSCLVNGQQPALCASACTMMASTVVQGDRTYVEISLDHFGR